MSAPGHGNQEMSLMHAEPTQKQRPSAGQQAEWIRENANALRECANTDMYYGRTEHALRSRELANRMIRFAGFLSSFPEGTSVTGYWSHSGGFRFRVPAPVGVAS